MTGAKEGNMSKRLAAIATMTAMTLLLAGIAAAAQFEGVAAYKITTTGGNGRSIDGTSKIFVTKTAYRMEMETSFGGAAAAEQGTGSSRAPRHMKMTMIGKVADPDELIMVNDENKTYSIWDLKKMRGDAAAPAPQTWTVKKLGSDKVAGVSCQKALLTSSKGSEIEVCMAKELAVSSDWFATMTRRQRDTNEWMQALKSAGLVGFPVRYVMRRGGKEALITMELTSLDKKSLSASLFEVPSGYKQTDYAIGGLTPEQRKAMADARKRIGAELDKMTPEQRKAFEGAMKKHGGMMPPPEPTPKP
jgi:Domain of unknown function (DUF4412)